MKIKKINCKEKVAIKKSKNALFILLRNSCNLLWFSINTNIDFTTTIFMRICIYSILCIMVQPASLCFVNNDIREKVLLHAPHEYFLMSECVWRWARRLDRSAKARWQKLHLKGFSPVCVLMCPWSSHGREKAFPHKWHLQGSVCVRMCIFKAPVEE